MKGENFRVETSRDHFDSEFGFGRVVPAGWLLLDGDGRNGERRLNLTLDTLQCYSPSVLHV